jgi:hypothetical protein
MISNAQLNEILNQNFGEPFLPNDFVASELTEDNTIQISIGRRDIAIDENGEVIGSGTLMGANHTPSYRHDIPNLLVNKKIHKCYDKLKEDVLKFIETGEWDASKQYQELFRFDYCFEHDIGTLENVSYDYTIFEGWEFERPLESVESAVRFGSNVIMGQLCLNTDFFFEDEGSVYLLANIQTAVMIDEHTENVVIGDGKNFVNIPDFMVDYVIEQLILVKNQEYDKMDIC